MTQSYRIRVELKPKAPVVFSYPDLLKKQEQVIGKSPLSKELENEQDNFFKSLLERAAKYDINPEEEEEEVDSGEEENVTSRDIRGNEYDYEDPFIDDSEMMLDAQYEYVEPEIDGYFVFHGSLDGEAVSNIKKKSKKEKTNPTNNKGKETTTTNSSESVSTTTQKPSISSTSLSLNKGVNGSSTTTTRKNNSNNDPIEISDTDEEPSNDKSSRIKKSSNINSDSTPTLKRSSSSSTTSSTDNNNNNNSKNINTNKTNKASSSTSSSTLINNTNHSQMNNSKNKSSINNNNDIANNDNDSSSNGSKKKRAIAYEDLKTLDTSIQPLMEKLSQDRQKEDFAIKSKFPNALRPTVVEIGIRMFRLYNTTDENVINHLMYILPYNRFTLNKFVTTKSGPIVINEWQQEIEDMIEKFKEVINDMMHDQFQQYENKLLEQQTSSDVGTNDVEQKFRFNETSKKLLYDILTKDMYRVLLKKEVNELTDKPVEDLQTETKARKTMYTKLLPCWPKGWMTTFDISRQYSIMKTSIKTKLKNAEEAASKTNNSSNNSSGFKRPNGTNLKRPAPSSSGSSPVSSRNMNNNNTSQNNDKRKKLNEPSTSFSTTTTNVNNENSNENELNANGKDIDNELNSSYQSPLPPPPSQPSQRPTSMKIESLISGP